MVPSIRLTTENANQYIGYDILFKTRGHYIVKNIISVSATSIQIDNPDLNNSLQILTRNIHVLLDSKKN